MYKKMRWLSRVLIIMLFMHTSVASGVLGDGFGINVSHAAENAAPIIIDHTSAKLSDIPEEWLARAKSELHIAYEHTSHGSQITTGMTGLVDFKGSLYAWNSGGRNGALDLRDRPSGAGDLGNSRWPEVTRNYLSTHPEANVIMWSWCGQVSSASEAYIDAYLNNMNALESEYPNVKFVYMTGHLDGTGIGGNLHQRNEQIRTYCEANNKILYDFADIESYDPEGVYYLDKGANDACAYDTDGNGSRDGNWATEWQAAHVEGVDWYNVTAAHSQSLNANLKAYAAWSLWARLAGWDGSTADQIPPKAPVVSGIISGQTYTTTVTPEWVNEAGTTSTATLTKDGGTPVPFASGTTIGANGDYILEVLSTKASNGLIASASLHFAINVQTTGDWNVGDFENVYEVGPGLAYETPNDVPWESLQPSTMVRIHWREEPYRNKWLITTTATSDRPVVVTGVPNNGRLPVISGENATTRPVLYYLNEVRSVVKVGNYTGASDIDRPAYIYIENLDIQKGYPTNSFTDRRGNIQNYENNAAAIHLEEGNHITIKNCNLHQCGNGIFAGHFTRDVLISGNSIFDNGVVGRYYEHNTYTESLGITYEYNHFGPLRDGCSGNNLKDRSAGTVVRYNWIESGNRQLDLVNTDYAEFFNDPSYNDTYVYGNILIEPDGAGNSQIIHYGGDGGDTQYFRRGTLHLYNNTIVSTRSSNTTLVRLSTDDVTADIQNNIIYTSASPGHLALTNGAGLVKVKNNWLTEGYRNSFESSQATILEETGNITGTDPGFTNVGAQDFKLAVTSVCIDSGMTLGTELSNYMLTMEYVKHQSAEARQVLGSAIDMGAYETETQETPPATPLITNILDGSTYIAEMAPEWTVENGVSSSATLTKDDGPAVPFDQGVSIAENGQYTLVVTATKDSNGLTASTTVKFTIEIAPVSNYTVSLLDSNGSGMAGGRVYYYTNQWVELGTTDASGLLAVNMPSGTENVTFRMEYAGGRQNLQQDLSVNPEVVFTTIDTVVKLTDSTGAALGDGVVNYGVHTWSDFGTTSQDGEVHKELLPGDYNFRIEYAGGSNEKQQNNGSDANVLFQTVNAVVTLQDSKGAGLSHGAVQYGIHTRASFGTTDPNGLAEMELLPREYNFRMEYEGGSHEIKQDLTSSSIVVFETVDTVVKLVDSEGNGLADGEALYGVYSWADFGLTDANGEVHKELLPREYNFRMVYAGESQQTSQVISLEAPVVSFTVSTDPGLTDAECITLDSEALAIGYYGSDNASSVTQDMDLPTSGDHGTSISWESTQPVVISNAGSVSRTQNDEVVTLIATITKGEASESRTFTLNVVALPASNTTVTLLDSKGVGLEGGVVKYYDNGWKVLGTTQADGTLSLDLPEGLAKTTIRVEYEGGSQKLYYDTSAGEDIVFNTVNTVFKLVDSSGNGLEDGLVKCYASGWKEWGSTDVNGEFHKELLSDKYTFRMEYANGKQTMTHDTGANSVVVFQTIETVVELVDSKGNGLADGNVKYYANKWLEIGQTADDGQVHVELLPGNYVFRMEYEAGKQDMKQDISENARITFQTADAMIMLFDSEGNGLADGQVKYYGNKWLDIGSTDEKGELHKELLPVNYVFRMEYDGGKQDVKQHVGDDARIVFQTIDVAIQLMDSEGNGLAEGFVKCYRSAWDEIGTTDSSGELHKELLPGKYTFRMEYEGGKQDVGQDIATDPNVVFQTIKARVMLTDSEGNGLADGIVTYYGNGWIQMGMTNGSGEVMKELLPCKYVFRMAYLGRKQEVKQDLSQNAVVVFIE